LELLAAALWDISCKTPWEGECSDARVFAELSASLYYYQLYPLQTVLQHIESQEEKKGKGP